MYIVESCEIIKKTFLKFVSGYDRAHSFIKHVVFTEMSKGVAMRGFDMVTPICHCTKTEVLN